MHNAETSIVNSFRGNNHCINSLEDWEYICYSDIIGLSFLVWIFLVQNYVKTLKN